ncbi:hypothetical protein ABK040_001716 [Willaertia magna]
MCNPLSCCFSPLSLLKVIIIQSLFLFIIYQSLIYYFTSSTSSELVDSSSALTNNIIFNTIGSTFYGAKQIISFVNIFQNRESTPRLTKEKIFTFVHHLKQYYIPHKEIDNDIRQFILDQISTNSSFTEIDKESLYYSKTLNQMSHLVLQTLLKEKLQKYSNIDKVYCFLDFSKNGKTQSFPGGILIVHVEFLLQFEKPSDFLIWMIHEIISIIGRVPTNFGFIDNVSLFDDPITKLILSGIFQLKSEKAKQQLLNFESYYVKEYFDLLTNDQQFDKMKPFKNLFFENYFPIFFNYNTFLENYEDGNLQKIEYLYLQKITDLACTIVSQLFHPFELVHFYKKFNSKCTDKRSEMVEELLVSQSFRGDSINEIKGNDVNIWNEKKLSKWKAFLQKTQQLENSIWNNIVINNEGEDKPSLSSLFNIWFGNREEEENDFLQSEQTTTEFTRAAKWISQNVS